MSLGVTELAAAGDTDAASIALAVAIAADAHWAVDATAAIGPVWVCTPVIWFDITGTETTAWQAFDTAAIIGADVCVSWAPCTVIIGLTASTYTLLTDGGERVLFAAISCIRRRLCWDRILLSLRVFSARFDVLCFWI